MRRMHPLSESRMRRFAEAKSIPSKFGKWEVENYSSVNSVWIVLYQDYSSDALELDFQFKMLSGTGKMMWEIGVSFQDMDTRPEDQSLFERLRTIFLKAGGKEHGVETTDGGVTRSLDIEFRHVNQAIAFAKKELGINMEKLASMTFGQRVR